MKSNQDEQQVNNEEKSKSIPINYFTLNIENRRSNPIQKKPSFTKNNENKNTASIKKPANQQKKENKNNENKTKIKNKQNVKMENNYSNSSQNNQPRKSSQNEGAQNKHITLSNVNTRRYELTNATISEDGVLRGYADNCSFYVSGSADLHPKTAGNSYNIKNNRSNRGTQPHKTYDSKTQVINLTDSNYRKTEVTKDSGNKNNKRNNDNKYKKNNYTSKTNVNTTIYNINQNMNNKKIDIKSSQDYSRKTKFETEPSVNIRNYNNRTITSDNIRQPFIPERNIMNKEPRATIKSININLDDNNNNNVRRVYNTSTHTHYEEKNKNHFYKSIIEGKSNESKKRNNTPNVSYRDDYRNNSNNSYRYNTERNSMPEKSLIPYNRLNRYKNNRDTEDNILNNSQRNYQPKYTLAQRYSNSNESNVNKNRYNFPETPKIREYGTKTEIHLYKNDYNRTILNNNERVSLYESPNRKYSLANRISDYKKEEPQKRYETRSVSTAIYNRGQRKYGIQTETLGSLRNNYTRVTEYEVPDINANRKQQNQKDNYQRKAEPINQGKTLYGNRRDKKESIFEKSLKNIRENEKEIEKDNNNFNRNRERNNHKMYVSTSITKDKKLYKTSTQTQAFRPYGYTLGSLNEYEVPVKKYQRNGNNININKNNYYNAMKNLEEEIEVDDENEQVEYLPPRPLNRINIKTKEQQKEKDNKYKYNINNKSTQQKYDNKNKPKTNYIINIKREGKIKIKDLNNNKDKERHTTGDNKNNITTDARNSQRNSNANKITSISIHNAKKEKPKLGKISIKNIGQSKPQEEKPKPKYSQYIPQHIHQIPTYPKRTYPPPTQKPKPPSNTSIQQKTTTQQPKSYQQKPVQQLKPKQLPQTQTSVQQNKNQNQKKNIQQIEQKVNKVQKKDNKQYKPIQKIKPQLQLKKQEPKLQIQIQNQNQIKAQQFEQVHQEVQFNEVKEKENNIEENEEVNNDNIEKEDNNNNNNIRKSKYGSYFGDLNNNYIEIKGVSSTKKEENEEEEENEQENLNNTVKKYDQPMQLVRNVTFGIHSENLCVPAQTDYDKEDKEADEQIMEEDEQNDENYNEDENEGDMNDMNNKYNQENNEEVEIIGEEMIDEKDESGNEEYNENEEIEIVEEFEDIENNANEEEEINENDKEE